jgi:hypothetical protein
MNRRKSILVAATLLLIGSTAGVLGYMRSHLRLSPPGVKTHPLPGSNRLQVDLPETVLDYTSEVGDVDEVTLKTLPQDTSFGQRRYKARDDFQLFANVVLMGTDRTSLHKPQFCLEGQGWHIDQAASVQGSVHIDRPQSYDLPIVALIASKEVVEEGQKKPARGVYVYWFVADDALSASVTGLERMRLMAVKLLRTGILQRWAYVSYFSVCAPGQETATLERMKQFVAASVPEFQLYPRPMAAATAATP